MSVFESIFKKRKKVEVQAVSLVFGWGTSGSTFLVQVLKRLGREVHKEHMYKAPDPLESYDLKLFTIRDPRDIITSNAKRVQAELWESGAQDEALLKTLEHFLAAGSMEAYRSAVADPSTLVVRYETFFNGREALLIRWICDQLGIVASDDRIEEILRDTSVEANMSRAEKMKDFSEWDRESLIHGNHITNKGKSGSWTTAFSDVVLQQARMKLTPALVELGYVNDQNW